MNELIKPAKQTTTSIELNEAQQQEKNNEWLETKPVPNIVIKNDNTIIPGIDVLAMSFSFDNSPASESVQHSRRIETVKQMTGSSSSEYASHLMTKVIVASTFSTKNLQIIEISANAHKEALLSLKPRDEIEGQLLTRMLVLHDKIMDCMGFSFKDDLSEEVRETYINRLAKVTRLYNESLEALNRYKRKGEQKMVVQHQHVNIANGGQAIVGDVHRG